MSDRRFIVNDGDGFARELYFGYDDAPRSGVLVIGDAGTLFISRRTARAAIARSLAYSEKFNLPWEVEKWKVQAVQ